jgi:hypothetical protein
MEAESGGAEHTEHTFQDAFKKKKAEALGTVNMHGKGLLRG